MAMNRSFCSREGIRRAKRKYKNKLGRLRWLVNKRGNLSAHRPNFRLMKYLKRPKFFKVKVDLSVIRKSNFQILNKSNQICNIIPPINRTEGHLLRTDSKFL